MAYIKVTYERCPLCDQRISTRRDGTKYCGCLPYGNDPKTPEEMAARMREARQLRRAGQLARGRRDNANVLSPQVEFAEVAKEQGRFYD